MEPNIRIETNKKGFCHRHFRRCLKKDKNCRMRLFLKVIFRKLLITICRKSWRASLIRNSLKSLKSDLIRVMYATESSGICTILRHDFVEWAKGEEFYKLYNEQPFICFKHYDFIMNVATQKSKLPSKLLPQFYAETAGLTKNICCRLKKISHISAQCLITATTAKIGEAPRIQLREVLNFWQAKSRKRRADFLCSWR